MKQIVIFGAKSIALGACLAIRKVYPEYQISGFMVSSLVGNVSRLGGLPVMEIDCFADKSVCILVATPEDIQSGIEEMLRSKGFQNIVCLDSEKESALMSRYYTSIGRFPALRSNIAEVYMAKFYRDKPLKSNYRIPDWIHPIQVGAALTNERVAEIADDKGENISAKNVNYCELTALCWIWKNRLQEEQGSLYLGLFHYRRFLELTDDDLLHMKNENVDVVLPYPTVHEPDIREHHSRYIAESDWNAMLQALKELEPEYARGFEDILMQPYLYNYNIVVAKRKILKDYCQWLFPILARTEELSTPKGSERADRYIGYLGENLLTLYFMYHAGEWNIKHVGRKMLI